MNEPDNVYVKELTHSIPRDQKFMFAPDVMKGGVFWITRAGIGGCVRAGATQKIPTFVMTDEPAPEAVRKMRGNKQHLFSKSIFGLKDIDIICRKRNMTRAQPDDDLWWYLKERGGDCA